LLSLALAYPLAASAQSVTPLQGQSAEQMQKDMAECQSLAQQSSAPAPVSAPPPRGERARGALVGAAAGAAAAEVRGQQHEAYDKVSDDVKQEYRQNQAKEAAAAGAVVGGAKQRRARREQSQAGEAQAAQAGQASQQAYQGCLMGRGYGVTP
jgi:hypothetical protein